MHDIFEPIKKVFNCFSAEQFDKDLRKLICGILLCSVNNNPFIALYFAVFWPFIGFIKSSFYDCSEFPRILIIIKFHCLGSSRSISQI